MGLKRGSGACNPRIFEAMPFKTMENAFLQNIVHFPIIDLPAKKEKLIP